MTLQPKNSSQERSAKMLHTKLEQLMIRFDLRHLKFRPKKLSHFKITFEKIESIKNKIDELNWNRKQKLHRQDMEQMGVRCEKTNNIIPRICSHILELREDREENLEVKLIKLAKEHQQVDIKPEEV